MEQQTVPVTNTTVLARYKSDLDKLIRAGETLTHALQYEYNKQDFAAAVEAQMGESTQQFLDDLPSFSKGYQPWYSEAREVLRQLLPERLNDFVRYYERPKTARKNVTYENYVIEDALRGLTVGTRLRPRSALRGFVQQVQIIESIRGRFESSLFDIRQLTQADVFDSELEAAKELMKNRFLRAAGVVAGVVLERHLKEVCARRRVTIRKQRPQLGDLNDKLKDAGVIDTSQWRFNQHLGDLRNLCAHDGDTEPSRDQVDDLLAGVAKVIKTVS